MTDREYIPTIEEYEQEYKDWFEKQLPKKLNGSGEVTDEEIRNAVKEVYEKMISG